MNTPRILILRRAVLGSIDGQISTAIRKLSALHEKNAFSFALVAGDLFGEASDAASENELQQLLTGKIEIPLPTYFALGRRVLPEPVTARLRENSGELCPNLYFLGRRTTVKTSEGVRIVALGGAFENEVVSDSSTITEFSPSYTYKDAQALKGAHSADILVTTDWPTGIKAGSRADYTSEDSPSSQQTVADLCSWLKPRYHFSTSDGFYQREPFFHAQDEGAEGYSITRFLSIAPFGNTSKQKWIYAFSLDPKAAPPVTVASDTTASPLSATATKRKEPSDTPTFSRYSNTDQDRGHRGKRKKMPPPTPQQCFFCLSNPNVAQHLITSIGDSAYLTTAKGPLSTSKTFKALGFPGHILIIPLEHSPTLASIQDSQSKADTNAEMHRYRGALQEMLKQKSESAPEAERLGAVTWEISRTGGVHVHWQFLPVPLDMIRRGLVEAAFKVEAENDSYPAFTTSKTTTETTSEVEQDFFKVTIWGEGVEEKVLTLPLDHSYRFDLQYGRRVLAKLLVLENRMQWQDCSQTEAEETADAEAFKEAFKEYDFAL